MSAQTGEGKEGHALPGTKGRAAALGARQTRTHARRACSRAGSARPGSGGARATCRGCPGLQAACLLRATDALHLVNGLPGPAHLEESLNHEQRQLCSGVALTPAEIGCRAASIFSCPSLAYRVLRVAGVRREKTWRQWEEVGGLVSLVCRTPPPPHPLLPVSLPPTVFRSFRDRWIQQRLQGRRKMKLALVALNALDKRVIP